MDNKKSLKIKLIIGVALFFTLVIGATFAYFPNSIINRTADTNIRSNGLESGNPTLMTNINNLGMSITNDMMNGVNAGISYYATPEGEAVVDDIDINHGRYILATANMGTNDVAVDCNYAYTISGAFPNRITDGSDEDVYIVLTDPQDEKTTYTLKDIMLGVTYEGKVLNLEPNTSKSILIESYLTNKEENQSDLAGGKLEITITPKSGVEGFKCDVVSNE